jgi:hypothetical protein
MRKMTVLCLFMSACATGPRADHVTRAPQPGCAAETPPAWAVGPDRRLPSVDRIARLVDNALGDRAAAEVELCVAGPGQAARVALIRGSGLEAFDAALVRDVADWDLPPATLADGACRRATIVYRGARDVAVAW